MEARVTVVEGEEAVHRELGAEVVVLSREHLLAHAGADLGLEVEDRSEAEVSSLSALSVVRATSRQRCGLLECKREYGPGSTPSA